MTQASPPPNIYLLLGDDQGPVTAQKMESVQTYISGMVDKVLQENGENAAGFLEVAFAHGVFVKTYANYLQEKENEGSEGYDPNAPPSKWFMDHNQHLMHILLNLCDIDKETVKYLAECCSTMNATVTSIMASPEASEKLN